MSSSNDFWNPLKFIETLTFFGEVPFVGNIRWLQQMLGVNPSLPAPLAVNMQPSVSVILKAQDSTAAETFQMLLRDRGVAVRSPRSPDDASQLDMASQIVNAQAILWMGVPGDETQLTTYVEALKTTFATEDYSLLDFSSAKTDAMRDCWGAVDDVVMGGVSTSGLNLLPDYGRFSGQVSTANSGGFASVRTRNFDPPFDLAAWQGVRLMWRGDGQRYKVILRNSHNWDSVAYCASVDTKAGQWVVTDIPFSAMKATFRARTQPTAPLLNPSSVCSFQLMLSKFEYDGEKNPHFSPGAFSLDVRSIGVYRKVSLPPLIAIAASPTQTADYTERLTQSELVHQVFEMGDQQNLPDTVVQMLAEKKTG
ncbi:MAG: CIA30 family protein [Leptolyngbya sp. SIO1D8]|nr:CIA30 family protein [Leptolyngbya sp. SIO1D8]